MSQTIQLIRVDHKAKQAKVLDYATLEACATFVNAMLQAALDVGAAYTLTPYGFCTVSPDGTVRISYILPVELLDTFGCTDTQFPGPPEEPEPLELGTEVILHDGDPTALRQVRHVCRSVLVEPPGIWAVPLDDKGGVKGPYLLARQMPAPHDDPENPWRWLHVNCPANQQKLFTYVSVQGDEVSDLLEAREANDEDA